MHERKGKRSSDGRQRRSAFRVASSKRPFRTPHGDNLHVNLANNEQRTE